MGWGCHASRAAPEVQPLEEFQIRDLVRKRLRTMHFEPEIIAKIEDEAASLGLRPVAENPQRCVLLIHVLLRRGFAGASERLRYIAQAVPGERR